MDNIRSCCITGHRILRKNDIDIISVKLNDAILQTIQDGYTVFISGFADGTDLLFAQLVVELRKTHNIFLEAALPYAGRMRQDGVEALLNQCNGIKILCDTYQPDCFMRRNRYMINQCSRVIAVYDGRKKGGTFATINYARQLQRDVRIIHI